MPVQITYSGVVGHVFAACHWYPLAQTASQTKLAAPLMRVYLRRFCKSKSEVWLQNEF
jgi:hypothetical protein